MENQFTSFLHNFIKTYDINIFSNISKCKSLLLDHAKGEYKKEIRLLLQALELGFYSTILNSNDLNLTRMTLIKQLQDEYFISEEISSFLIDLLLLELKNYKPIHIEKVIELSKEENQKLFVNNNKNNTINLNVNNIQELISLITSKSSQQVNVNQDIFNKAFNNKLKTVYEPTFFEFQETMYQNNLVCCYYVENDINTYKFISFSFLFVYHNHSLSSLNNKSPTFFILRNNDNTIMTSFQKADLYNNFYRKTYQLEELTKEIIISNLENIMIEIMNELKRKDGCYKIREPKDILIEKDYIYPKGFLSTSRLSSSSIKKDDKDIGFFQEYKEQTAHLITLFNNWAANPISSLPYKFTYVLGDFEIRTKLKEVRETTVETKWIINRSGEKKYLLPNPNFLDIMTDISELYKMNLSMLKERGKNRIQIIIPCEIASYGFIEYQGELKIL